MTDSGTPLVPPFESRLTPDAIAAREFATAKRGYVETEVRAFLRMLADEFSSLVGRERDLAYRVRQLEERLEAPVPPPSDQELIAALGEETARVLGQAREAAMELRGKAEEHARRVVKEAQDHARDLRANAQQASEQKTREAEDVARTRANEIVGEARTLRDRVLGDLSERREQLERQVGDLRAGRAKLVEAYELVDTALRHVTGLIAEETSAFTGSRPAPAAGARAETTTETTTETAGDGDGAGPEDEARAAADEGAADGDAADGDAAADASDAAAETAPDAVTDEPAAAEGAESAGEPARPEGKDVGALFQQLRGSAGAEATRDTGAARAPADADGPDAAPAAEVEAELEGDAALLAARDSVLAEISGELSRRAKRALQDEQNDILDGVRRQRGKIDTGRVLPAADDQVDRWRQVLHDGVDRAYAAGAASAGGDAGHAPAAVLGEIASAMVAPLRDRLGATLATIDEPTPADTEIAIASGLGARYREWRTQHLDALVGDALAAAHARGVYDSAGEGARLRWVTPAEGACADCDDNSLEPTTRGDDFPTGQPHPPAHPGCRCLLVVER